MCSCIVAILSMFSVDGADVTNGADKMFEATVAAVIGGALITGGFGSLIGTAFGALLFGMVSQGFFFTEHRRQLVRILPRRDDADRHRRQRSRSHG